MNTPIAIAPNSPLYQPLMGWTRNSRMLFLAGLPGVGKTLLLQQCALMAQAQGRSVHLLQWDVARSGFATAEISLRYPEDNGSTHPAIRKATGLWAREAVARWHAAHDAPAHLLLGELPIVGNRLVELLQPSQDEAEPLLRNAQFVVPVPSLHVRNVIEAARERTIAKPTHAREAADAPPNVLRALWDELHGLAVRMHIAGATVRVGPTLPEYNPAIYAGAFLHLLRHRTSAILPVNDVLPHTGSAYVLDGIFGELQPTPAEAVSFIALVESMYSPAGLSAAVDQWWMV